MNAVERDQVLSGDSPEAGDEARGASAGPPLLPLAALGVIGAWSIAVPYLGRALGLRLPVPPGLEVVDHVVPGIVALTAGALLFALARRGRAGGLVSLAAACTIALASLWITVTHIPLLVDAGQGLVPWATAIFHSASGPLMLALSLRLVVLELREPT